MTTPPGLVGRIGDLARRLLSLRPAWRDLTGAVRWKTARTASRGLGAALGFRAVVGSARPLKILVLSLAALAAGGLGLMVAYAATPDDGLATQVLVTNGETYTVATITGPGGETTTVAVTKTKTGKTKYIPVRVTSTVDGPGDTEEVFVEVAGESVVLTETDTNILSQIVKQIETQVVTQHATEFQTVTLPPDTVTLPPDTVTLPAETVTDTVTLPAEIVTVTLPAETVTVTLPGETVTVTGPGP
jgi:hypothetical protein